MGHAMMETRCVINGLVLDSHITHANGTVERTAAVDMDRVHYLFAGRPPQSDHYNIRSERQLMEQLNYNLLFRWGPFHG